MSGDPGNREDYAKARSAVITLVKSNTTFNPQGVAMNKITGPSMKSGHAVSNGLTWSWQ